jgi:two-component system, OmpR family, response regulator
MSLKIYLVEDHSLVLDALARALEELAQAKVMGSAATESEACQWLKAHQDAWDLAVVDLKLAQGNGIDVIKCVKGRAADQKVVVLTSYGSRQVRELCLSSGADEFFDKLTQTGEFCDYVLRAA